MADRRSIDGVWHLLPADWEGGALPQHRVDFVFHDEETLHGSVMSRVDGREFPLAELAFDGRELRLRMSPPPNTPVKTTPALVMTAVQDHFEGTWDNPQLSKLRLKLVPGALPPADAGGVVLTS